MIFPPVAYTDILCRLDENRLLHGEAIESLEAEHIEKIFANYKAFKYKSRLYSLAINHTMKERHFDIALNYISKSSFDVVGNYSVPFRLSYLKKIPKLKQSFIEFIAEASSRFGKVNRGRYGFSYIDIKFDLPRSEFRKLLFFTVMQDPKKYEEIMHQMGYKCKKCNNTGVFRGRKCIVCEGRSKKNINNKQLNRGRK